MKKENIIKGICCWLLAISYTSGVICQEIKIGQQVPDIEMKNVFNYHSEKIKMSDLKGKLVIVEFWGTRCVACLREFPKLDSLQKIFGDKLQILLVNRQDKEYIKDFLAKRKKIKVPAIPFVTNETVLYQYFPHNGNPYQVWIDPAGKLIATPDSYILSSEILKNYFAGKDIKLSNDSRGRYERTLFNPEWEPYLGYYSYISKCISHGNFHLTGPGKKEFSFTSGYCTSILSLFQMAYNDSIDNESYKFGRPGRTILEVNDPSDYLYPKEHSKLHEWYDNHTYYYQSCMPGNSGLNRFRIMREDLARYFNIDAKVEIRKIRSFALVRTSNIDKIKSKGGQAQDNLRPTDEKSMEISPVRYYINKPFTGLLVKLNAYVEKILGQYFEDKTGYKGNIDISMDGNIVDSLTMEGLRAELRKYDLDLLEEWIDVEVLVLREKDFKMTQQQAKLK